MSAALFVGNPEPVMANYIPVLRSSTFLGGLLAFLAGFTVLVLRAFYALLRDGDWSGKEGALRFALLTSVLAGLAAILVFVLAYFDVPKSLQPKAYYELLFWGGGHLMQFVYTQLALVAWLWLASASGAIPRLGARAAVVVFAIGVAAILLTPFYIVGNGPETAQYRLFFTYQMQYGGGIAATVIGAVVVLALWRSDPPPADARAERSTLWASLLVFGTGGVIGFLISGSNVTIPAHYHGSIVGVTLAFMGMTYHLLPKLGFQTVSQSLAVWQSRIYCSGQLLHIIGLAWSGGYGVQRKTAGAAQGLDSLERIVSMGMMGLGGFIAIVGGIIFLVVVFKSILGGRRYGKPTR
jgi:heme/copper-type cytochrome/quinol oxidase subunit 1